MYALNNVGFNLPYYVSSLSRFMPVHCSLVVTCSERADLLADYFMCCFIVFLSLLGQVWCLIVFIPNRCYLSFFFDMKDHVFENIMENGVNLLIWSRSVYFLNIFKIIQNFT